MTKAPSRYGSQNAVEYFAETFAGLTGGRPDGNAKAMRDWLDMQKGAN